jgi:hypothetical protein
MNMRTRLIVPVPLVAVLLALAGISLLGALVWELVDNVWRWR